jgi:hypothetical protein
MAARRGFDRKHPGIAAKVFHGCQGMFLVRIDKISPGQSSWSFATLSAQCGGVVSLGVRNLSPQDIHAPEPLAGVPGIESC